MRLFGLIGGTLSESRATYWFTPPFDLTFAEPAGSQFAFGQGGVVFELNGTLLQYQNVMMGFPTYAFVAPAAAFNPQIEDTPVQGECLDTDQEIYISSANVQEVCTCP